MTTASTQKTPVTPVPAATLLLLRDSPEGIEVLLTTRHDAAGFAAGTERPLLGVGLGNGIVQVWG